MAIVIIVINNIIPIFLVLLIMVKTMATKIRFITSPKDEIITKKYSKYWPGLKLPNALKTKASIDQKYRKWTKTVSIMNATMIAMN